MSAISIAILLFVILETLNIMMLYFMPDANMGNGIGVFKAWERSKEDEEMHRLVSYLVNWVAGTKLIFIALLIVILATGGADTKLFTAVALIASIASFYWRLFPTIKTMDKAGELTTPGYSKTLGIMITCFIGVFIVALAWTLIS